MEDRVGADQDAVSGQRVDRRPHHHRRPGGGVARHRARQGTAMGVADDKQLVLGELRLRHRLPAGTVDDGDGEAERRGLLVLEAGGGGARDRVAVQERRVRDRRVRRGGRGRRRAPAVRRGRLRRLPQARRGHGPRRRAAGPERRPHADRQREGEGQHAEQRRRQEAPSAPHLSSPSPHRCRPPRSPSPGRCRGSLSATPAASSGRPATWPFGGAAARPVGSVHPGLPGYRLCAFFGFVAGAR